jgi:hypothetical protein
VSPLVRFLQALEPSVPDVGEGSTSAGAVITVGEDGGAPRSGSWGSGTSRQKATKVVWILQEV